MGTGFLVRLEFPRWVGKPFSFSYGPIDCAVMKPGCRKREEIVKIGSQAGH